MTTWGCGRYRLSARPQAERAGRGFDSSHLQEGADVAVILFVLGAVMILYLVYKVHMQQAEFKRDAIARLKDFEAMSREIEAMRGRRR